MKLFKKRNSVNRNSTTITLIVCASVLVLAITGSLIYINQQNILASERAQDKQLQEDRLKSSKEESIEAAKLKQAKLETCLKNIDPSLRLQELARSSCYYDYDHS